jgi:hypothetical protein
VSARLLALERSNLPISGFETRLNAAQRLIQEMIGSRFYLGREQDGIPSSAP